MRFLSLSVLVAALVCAGCSRRIVPVEVDRIEVTRAEATSSSNETGSTVATSASADVRQRAQAFLDAYTDNLLPLYYASAQAQWDANTRIVEGDSTNALLVQEADEAYAAFTGSAGNIQQARYFLERKDALTDLQVRQLESILYSAASNPQTVPALVSERIAAETAQSEKLYGYTYRLGGEEVTTNDLDRILNSSDDLAERREAWEVSKQVGPTLTEGLMRLRDLRNGVVQALGYENYFAYQVSDYGMSSEEMLALMEQLNSELRPLYRELHTWARYTLAERYGEPVPDLLPAHWLPNRWGQDWSALVEVEGADLDAALEERGPEWLVEQSERFYTSLGFEPLPASFYERSSLYPLPEGADYKKNNHASAWHLDLDRDVRSLMSVEPNRDWYETTHHELGHIYYYLSYTNPNVPPLLRGGADRAYHEAVGSLMGLASLQPRFVQTIGLAAEGPPPDPIQALMKEALNYVVFIPWSASVMTQFEYDLYAEELSQDELNKRWWTIKRQYQGIVPPDASRSEMGVGFNDAATKTHINDDAAQYYDYALSNVLLFQLHDHIARTILEEDPRDTNYYGQPEVGDFLKGILEKGATVDSGELLREATGQSLTAQPMLDYFEPLMEWLQEQNKGRAHTI